MLQPKTESQSPKKPSTSETSTRRPSPKVPLSLPRSQVRHLQLVRSLRPNPADRGQEEQQDEGTGLRGLQGGGRSDLGQEQSEWLPHLRQDNGTCAFM